MTESLPPAVASELARIGAVLRTDTPLAAELTRCAHRGGVAALLRALSTADLRAALRGGALAAVRDATRVGPVVVQVEHVVDVGQPRAAALGSAGAAHARRALLLRVHDGHAAASALEHRSLAQLWPIAPQPGVKLLLRDVPCRRGVLLLAPACVEALGGSLPHLVAAAAAERAAALRATGGLLAASAARAAAADAPPPFSLPPDLRVAAAPRPDSPVAELDEWPVRDDAPSESALRAALERTAAAESTTADSDERDDDEKADNKADAIVGTAGGKFAPITAQRRRPATTTKKTGKRDATSTEAKGNAAPTDNNDDSDDEPKRAPIKGSAGGKFAPITARRRKR